MDDVRPLFPGATPSFATYRKAPAHLGPRARFNKRAFNANSWSGWQCLQSPESLATIFALARSTRGSHGQHCRQPLLAQLLHQLPVGIEI